MRIKMYIYISPKCAAYIVGESGPHIMYGSLHPYTSPPYTHMGTAIYSIVL